MMPMGSKYIARPKPYDARIHTDKKNIVPINASGRFITLTSPFIIEHHLKNNGNFSKKMMSSLCAASPSARTAAFATIFASKLFKS